MATELLAVSGNRKVYADITLLDRDDPDEWERAYQLTMDEKYKKGTRGWSDKIQGKEWTGKGEPPIFLIPRTRAGPSYKEVELEGCEAEDLQYCCVSKGYGMQDLSSFTLGPVVGEGLCVVNAAFSKMIGVEHVEGGGVFDLARKSFWQGARSPTYTITEANCSTMKVDGIQVRTMAWLAEHFDEWHEEWEKWRRAIALCSMGDFHWADKTPTIGFYYHGRFLNFVEWKKRAYINPAYELAPKTAVYQFLKSVREEHRRPLGLVHPKAREEGKEQAITREYLRALYDGQEMSCLPVVVVGLLLGIPIYVK